jgi:dTDP-4-amino-4,6-dideoxygalactose transaminase
MNLAKKYNLLVIEDAAQAIDSYYTFSDGTKKPLGSIGHLAAFSFHETKNIISGEGGMLAINDDRFVERAEIIWEKGTNRSQFFRGEINKYGWVDTGSSFLPSEVIAAFLWAQLENIKPIQEKRKQLWETYYNLLSPLAKKVGFLMPIIPDFATNNAHMFYIVFNDANGRDSFINYLKAKQVNPVFHYLSLHTSDYYTAKHDGRDLVNSDKYTEGLVRMPLYYDLQISEIESIVDLIKANYE